MITTAVTIASTATPMTIIGQLRQIEPDTFGLVRQLPVSRGGKIGWLASRVDPIAIGGAATCPFVPAWPLTTAAGGAKPFVGGVGAGE
jgi:hypothetical protein